MKLSQLRPYDVCGGKIAPSFYVIRLSFALFKPRTTNEVLGLTQFFQGSLGLAEVFAPDQDVVVVAMDDKELQELTHEFFVCQNCYIQPIDFPMLVERKANRAPLDT